MADNPISIRVPPNSDALTADNWREVQRLAKRAIETKNKVDSPTTGLSTVQGKIKIDVHDAVADYLGSKLLAGTGVTLSAGMASGGKTLTINGHVPVTLATNHGLSLSGQALAMGTPTTVSAATANAVTTTTHSHAISLAINDLSDVDITSVADTNVLKYDSASETWKNAAFSGLTDGDKGDITVSGSGTTWTIDNNAVTLAKLATQAAESILANATAGAAVPTALEIAEQTVVGRITGGHVVGLTPTQIRTLINVADGANAYVHPNHSGDVTSVADGAQTIATAAVSLAKMADLAQDKIIGRATASTGVPEAIACTAAGRALLDDASAADQRTTLGVGTGDSPVFVTAKLSGLTDGYVPYHKTDADGLANSPVSVSSGNVVVTPAASSEATLGATLITNGDFATNDLTGWTAAAGWSAATGKAVHTAGTDTTPLVQAVSVTNGSVYQVTCTSSDRTAGTLTLTFGSLTGSYSVGANVTSNYTFSATATESINLAFTPDAAFNGAIDDIRVKLVTENTTPIMLIKDSAGGDAASIRASYTLQNVGVGFGALRYNTTGNTNSAQGAYALYFNTTGSYNSAQGAYALYFNTTGNYNSAQGRAALYSNTTGINNSAQGYAALFSNTTGGNNSAQGYQAGYYIADGVTANTTSDYCVYVGPNTKASADGAQNETVIGYNAIGAGSNTVQLGNTSVTAVKTSGKYYGVGANITVSEYADNAAAVAAGLAVGDFYRTGDLLKVVHA